MKDFKNFWFDYGVCVKFVVALFLCILVPIHIGKTYFSTNENINAIMKFLSLISGIFFLIFTVLIFADNDYRHVRHRSLLLDTISPDREGNILQLLIRARRYSKAENEKHYNGEIFINFPGVMLGHFSDSGISGYLTSRDSEEGHVLCLGGSGSGKTTAVLIPTLLCSEANFFCIDLGGDIIKNVWRARKNPQIINPYETSSATFDIWSYVDEAEDKTEQIERISQIANIIIPPVNPEDVKGDGAFYTNNANLLLRAGLITYYYSEVDFCDACFNLMHFSSEEILREIKRVGIPNATILINSLGDIKSANFGGIKQELDSYISLFATNGRVQHVLHRPIYGQTSLTVKSLEDGDVFLRIPHDKLDVYRPLVTLLTTAFLEQASRRPLDSEKTIIFALDEFAALGKFSKILDYLRILRKSRVRILLFTQSLADIDQIYGKDERKVILDNCDIKLALKISDPDSQDYFSRLIGEVEVEKKSRTYSAGQVLHTYSTARERIVPPEEFGKLTDELICHRAEGYLRLKKAYFWKEDFDDEN